MSRIHESDTWRDILNKITDGKDITEIIVRCGITVTEFCQWLAGTAEPRADQLQTVCDIYGITLGKLMNTEPWTTADYVKVGF